MRNLILFTGVFWTTASDLARASLAFTTALKSSNELISKPLAETLTIPSSTKSRSLGFFLGDKNTKEDEMVATSFKAARA